MGVDQDRQETQRARRAAIIGALSHNFDLGRPDSPLTRFRDRIVDGGERVVVANADVDGLTASMMIASVSDWRIGVLIDKTGFWTHPDVDLVSLLEEPESLFGIDVFSTRFPGISNHPIYFGTKPKTPIAVRAPLNMFDVAVAESLIEHGGINLSGWTGIKASFGSKEHDGLPYKYPLGSAQLVLAALEAAQLPPTFFDRQFLPWLVANCDGGVDTIRNYPWNAELWWGALAAKVGPQSISERIYQLVAHQRPNEFLDLDRRLRYDEPVRSAALNTKWNLANGSLETIAQFISLVSDLSGWPDPFRGHAHGLAGWTRVTPERGVLPIRGLTQLDPVDLTRRLTAALGSVHMNMSVFRERGAALGWMTADPATDVPEDIPVEESTIGVEQSIEDALPFG